MLAQSLPGSGLPVWQTLTVALIGLASAGLTFLVGYIVVSRRRLGRPRVREDVIPPDPFVHGSVMEKRRALRRRGNPIKILVADAEATQEPEEAWVLDRSVGGLCLQVSRQTVIVGTILSVRSRNAPPGIPWTQVEVTSCREDDDGWELGCKFVKTPTWSVLLLFG